MKMKKKKKRPLEQKRKRREVEWEDRRDSGEVIAHIRYPVLSCVFIF